MTQPTIDFQTWLGELDGKTSKMHKETESSYEAKITLTLNSPTTK